MTDAAKIARGQWETCHIGSCLRHKECMYTPCRNSSAQNSKGSEYEVTVKRKGA